MMMIVRNDRLPVKACPHFRRLPGPALLHASCAAFAFLAFGAAAAARSAQASPPERGEASADLNGIADASLALGKVDQATRALTQALDARRADPAARRRSFYRMGVAATDSGEYARALIWLNRAATSSDAAHDTRGLAAAETAIGEVYIRLGQNDKADKAFRRAVALAKTTNDLALTAAALRGAANAAMALGGVDRASALFRESMMLAEAAGDRREIAKSLQAKADAESALGQYPAAAADIRSGLALARAVKDTRTEGNLLLSRGNNAYLQSQYPLSAQNYEQALAIGKALGDPQLTGDSLAYLGNAYNSLGDYGRALPLYERALAIEQRLHSMPSVCAILGYIGNNYLFLGEYADAARDYEQAIQVARYLKDTVSEGIFLNGLGRCQRYAGNYEAAVAAYKKATVLERASHDRAGIANSEGNLGEVYWLLKQEDAAETALREALRLATTDEDRSTRIWALANWGNVHLDRKETSPAIDVLEQALSAASAAKTKRAIAYCEYRLMAANTQAGNLPLAIFYGKRSVNTFQTMRAGIRNLGKGIQRDYAATKAQSYRALAGLLVRQNRLPEALQVLDLLKQEEYLNFSRPSAGSENLPADLLSQQTALAPIESGWAEAVEKAGGDEAAIRKALTGTAASVPPTGVDAGTTASADRLLDTPNALTLRHALGTIGDGAVALYTFLTEDGAVHLLLAMPDRLSAPAVSSTLKGDELDRKIVAFRAALQSPNFDPRPAGKALYDLLIGPIHADLEAAHAKTLLVSLDGNLRYIPLAALSPDGTHYLVESYRTALYTPAAIANLTREPKANWTALAMGVSQPPAGFAPLPAVPDELRAIVRASGDPAGRESGLFSGVRLMNATFSQKAMLAGLSHRYPLVHIASHFVFTGDETTSFLLLGDGSHLTLAGLKALPDNVFDGVNLLTLSACETATGKLSSGGAAGSGGNGSQDVENVAVLAQRKGADAVLASLWSVSDESTSLLMRTFYRDRQGTGANGAGSGESKAEALRQAQIALLTGVVKTPVGGLLAKRSDLLSAPPTASVDAPPFTPDPAKPWAHPFYWAPFILIGNER